MSVTGAAPEVIDENALPADSTSEQLSLFTKLAYGSGDLGTAISAALRAFFLLFFFTDVARLDPATAGLIVLINRLWDAFNDPIIGWLSDRTQSRWGRRRPWLLFGAIPFGLSFFLLWLVPPFGDTGKFIYYVIVVLMLDTAYTVINVPYAALTPELTRDYDERTSLNSYRFAFSVAGALISAVLHPIIVAAFESQRTGYMISGLTWAIVSTIPCFIVFWGTRERPESISVTAEHQMPFLQQIRVAFSNVAYRYVVLLYLFSWLALQMVSAVLIFYMTYYIREPERLPIVLLAIQGASFLALFLWSAVSRRLDKRYTYMIGATLWLAMQIALYFVTPETRGLIIPIAMLAGAGVAVAYLIPWAMIPDVIEIDEWETGQRREGIFYGFMVFLQKAGIAGGIYLVGQALASAQYITPTDANPAPIQPDSALQAIRLLIGPVPALILACSILLIYFYPITREGHERMLAALKQRQIDQQPAANR